MHGDGVVSSLCFCSPSSGDLDRAAAARGWGSRAASVERVSYRRMVWWAGGRRGEFTLGAISLGGE
jgi:hypothetical protein